MVPEVGLKVAERVAGELKLFSRQPGRRLKSPDGLLPGGARDGEDGSALDTGGDGDCRRRLTGHGEQAVEKAILICRPGDDHERVTRAQTDAVVSRWAGAVPA